MNKKFVLCIDEYVLVKNDYLKRLYEIFSYNFYFPFKKVNNNSNNNNNHKILKKKNRNQFSSSSIVDWNNVLNRSTIRHFFCGFFFSLKILSHLTIDRSILKSIRSDNTHGHLMKKYTHIYTYVCVWHVKKIEEKKCRFICIEVLMITTNTGWVELRTATVGSERERTREREWLTNHRDDIDLVWYIYMSGEKCIWTIALVLNEKINITIRSIDECQTWIREIFKSLIFFF